MQGLSYGVVRVDQENSLTSLTLQDCGQVLPGGKKFNNKCDRFPVMFNVKGSVKEVLL